MQKAWRCLCPKCRPFGSQLFILPDESPAYEANRREKLNLAPSNVCPYRSFTRKYGSEEFIELSLILIATANELRLKRTFSLGHMAQSSRYCYLKDAEFDAFAQPVSHTRMAFGLRPVHRNEFRGIRCYIRLRKQKDTTVNHGWRRNPPPPPRLLGLIKESTKARIRASRGYSRSFESCSGIWQGRALSPIFF